MKAILLAAGLGVRLKPLTENTPKCMIMIKNRPLLDYWIEILEKGGVEEVLINLHYLPNIVENYLREKKTSLKIKTVYEPSLLGTGGTILANKDFFSPGPVMVIHADNYSIFDLKEFARVFKNRKKNISMTMMTFETDDPENSGIVTVDFDGTVIEFHEKKKHTKGNIANGAVYLITSEIIEFMGKLNKEVIDFSLDVIPFFMGKINTYHNDIYHIDIGTIKNLKKLLDCKSEQK